jgi:hypothetical protein
MPSRTLLEVVDMYLIKTNGFRVQSIFDTEESEGAAKIAEDVFYQIVQKVPDIQFKETLINLEHSNVTSEPNYLVIPDTVGHLFDNIVKYNHTDSGQGITDNYRPVQYIDPREFLDVIQRNTNKDSNMEEVTDPSGVTYLVRNDKHPDYYTSFDGKHLAFDSYNSSEDASLQSSKSIAFVSKEPVFLIQDDFQIPLPDYMMMMYQDGVVAEASETIRQEAMPSARRRFNAEMAKLQQANRRVGQKREARVSYGRNRSYY